MTHQCIKHCYQRGSVKETVSENNLKLKIIKDKKGTTLVKKMHTKLV